MDKDARTISENDQIKAHEYAKYAELVESGTPEAVDLLERIVNVLEHKCAAQALEECEDDVCDAVQALAAITLRDFAERYIQDAEAP